MVAPIPYFFQETRALVPLGRQTCHLGVSWNVAVFVRSGVPDPGSWRGVLTRIYLRMRADAGRNSAAICIAPDIGA